MVKLWAKLAILIKKRVQDSIIAKIALVLSLVVVFCTTYLLILPALTISTGNSSSVFQSSESASSQVESPTDDSQKENNQTEAPSQASPTESSQEKKDMSQAGTLNAETSDITVNVSYEGNTFSEPVQLKVKPVEDTSAIDDKLTTLLSESKQELSQAHSYDISFVTDEGKEVEPSKDVKVSMNFKNDLSTSDDKQAGWKLYHFVDNDINQVQDLTESTDTDIKETGDGAVESIDFKSNTFSTYTLAGVTYADFSGYLTGAKCTTTPTYTESTKTLTTDIGLSFKISKETLLANDKYALELPDDTAWPSNFEGSEYQGYDEDNHSLAYNYKFVQQDGKKYIVITFRDDYINSAGEDVTGTLNYTATIGSTYRKDDKSYSIKYSDNATVEIPAKEIVPQKDEASYDVKSSKSGKVEYNGDQADLIYTVKVWSDKGTKGEITLKDALSGDNLADIQIGSIEIDSIKKNNESLKNINKTDASDKKSFTMTLPKLNANESYEIKYRYKVKQFPAGKAYAIKNDITLESPEIDNPGNSNSWLTIERNKITKDGKYNSDDNTITWTIEVNKNHNDIAGATLKDDMFSDAISGKVDISPSTGYEKTSDGYKFVAVDNNGKNTQHYTISYKTKAGEVDKSWNSNPVTQTNTVELDDNGEKSKATKTVDEGQPQKGGLSKSFENMTPTSDSHVKELSWKSVISLPGNKEIPEGTEFTDELVAGNNNDWYSHYYTKAQLDDIYQKLKAIFGDIEFSVQESGTWQDISYNQISSDKTYRVFKFKLKKDYKGTKDITLEYKSSIRKSIGLVYTNTISSDGYSATDKYLYEEKNRVTKMDADTQSWNQVSGSDFQSEDTSQTISPDGNLSWAVKVELEDDTTSVTITDTPPAGLKLVGFAFGSAYNSMINSKYDITSTSITWGDPGWPGQYEISSSGIIDDNGAIKMTFTAINGKTIKKALGDSKYLYAKFTFKYTGELPLDDSLTKKLTNKASASLNGDPVGSDEHTKTVTITPRQKLTKSGEWHEGDPNNPDDIRGIHYKLDLNPDAQDLNADSDTYTVTDTLTYTSGGVEDNISYSLLDDTVKLIDSSGNEVQDGWSWKVKEVKDGLNTKSILTVVVPDNQKYTLKYVYGVSGDIIRSHSYTVNNTASIDGIKTGSAEHKETWETHSTSGTAKTDRSIVINKVDSDNYRKKLKGAVFAVYKYDDCNNIYNWCDDKYYHRYDDDEVVGYYVSDENGQISISKKLLEYKNYYEPVWVPFYGWVVVGWINSKYNFEDNQLYYVKEVLPPEGYDLPENPEVHYFYYGTSCYDHWQGCDNVVNLAKTGASFRVENKKIKQANLTVKKEWLDADGKTTSVVGPDVSVKYKIMQAVITQGKIHSEVYKDSQRVYDNLELNQKNNWKTTFTDLPLEKDGERCFYYVEEYSYPGYDTSYSNGSETSTNPIVMATDSSDGQITIKNKAQKQYNLPETGGSGVKMHYVLGAALVLLTTGLIILKAYKTYQTGGDS
ncbi:Cna B-type domain-containing protein [Streptococcus ruminicola]|uniref:Cna B-type domain-containing protein n=1 Tax=Streptococcus ruminicola TaxID=2686210 RepID=UPI0024145B5F|nr:Cna B-type domain-containing protein [Streptococcus ruminicola]WFM81787.1 Cna B-type domain-containing protein [Streptococcus ruminicola]